MVVQVEVYKIVLLNIIREHRHFVDTWRHQTCNNLTEWMKLVKEMAHKRIYATNRLEFISMAIHSLCLIIQTGNWSKYEYQEFAELAEAILEQFETKFSNRYLHDIRVYRFKRLVKHQSNHVVVFLIEYKRVNLNPLTVNEETISNREIDYNFELQSKFHYLLLLTGLPYHNPIISISQSTNL